MPGVCWTSLSQAYYQVSWRFLASGWLYYWRIPLVKKLLALLALLWAPLAGAQSSANFLYKHTLADAVNYVYGVMTGANGSAWASGIPGTFRLTTSGSSTTFTCSTAGCFTPVSAGDTILLSTDTVTSTPYRVITKTDVTNVVVDTAANLGATGVIWQWYKETRGTTAASGWAPVHPADLLTFEYNSGTGTANVVWECRGSGLGASAVQIYPDNSAGAASRSYAASGSDSRTSVVVPRGYAFCRIGVKGTSPVVTAYVSRMVAP